MTLHKTYDVASFKTLEDEAPGRFEAVVAVFGNVDLQGDRIKPGAFKNTIDNYRRKGNPLPVIWSHQWISPEAHIGVVQPEDIEEIAMNGRNDGVVGGLKITGTMDVHKPFAGQVFDLLKERRVREWSFAYDVVAENKADDGANELLDLELIEAGPALKGANPATFTISAKAAVEHDLLERVKAATKPWHVEQRGDQYCVVKDDGGETVACHETREDAEAQIRALYANESNAVLEEAKAEFKWDGAAAMRSCKTAGDFRQIAFERSNDSDPDTAAHWALPHHPRPGAEADAAGVSAALAALHGGRGGAPDLKQSVDSVENHLERHAGSEKAVELKIGRVIGAKAASALKENLASAVDAFVAEVNGASEPKTEEPEPDLSELATIKARIAAAGV